MQLVLDNNVGLFYKVLVIATGCRHTPPFKYNPDSYTIYANKAVCEETTERVGLAMRVQQSYRIKYNNLSTYVILKIEKARSIAIVGGGAVGCEVAAEIKDLYKASLKYSQCYVHAYMYMYMSFRSASRLYMYMHK